MQETIGRDELRIPCIIFRSRSALQNRTIQPRI